MRVMNNCSTLKHLALAALFLAAAIVLLAPAAQASGIMVTNDSTECVNNGYEINCRNKTLVTAPVSYGDRAMLDIAYHDTVAGPGGGESQPLEEVLRLVVSKTPPVLRYPLRYLHMVSFQPHEELRLVQNLYPGVQACIDAAVNNPTCGWTLAANGSRIEDSQGFCSNRDLDQLQTYDPDLATWRGEELCRQSTLEDSFSVAHCLRTGALHFTGYEIGEYNKDFTITATLSKNTVVLDQLFLSPDAPLFLLKGSAMGGHDIIARLQNGITAAAGAPDLSNYILYVPTDPPDNPMVADYQNNMLLVPREMVTIDGSECNKVGTGFRAFRAQAAGAAKADAGDCLANQLYHLYQQDLSLLTQNPNAETKYLVTGRKMFKGVAAERAGNELSLIYKSAALEYSTVHLTLDPANITEVINEAIGIIKEASVREFKSMTGDGKLVAVIQNVGKVQTDYIVSVTDCQPGVNDGIPAQARTLDPQEEAAVEFNIDRTQNAGDSSHNCMVTLRASSGRSFDSAKVLFDTKKHNTVYARDLYQENKDSRLSGGCPTTTTAQPVTSTTTTIEQQTSIELAGLSAAPSSGQVTLKWKTESEIDNVGFNIWRAEGFVKLNDALIPAAGSPMAGAEYDFVDEWVLNGKRYTYLIEDVDTGGISTFHGPVNATPRLIYGIGK